MSAPLDLLVIGAGMAGTTAARRCAAAGWRVGIVDALPYGGTCALRGCDPKKMLRRGAEIIDAARLMRGKGVEAGDLQINWPELMAHKRSFTDAVPAKMEGGMKSAGVETLHGQVRFVNETTAEFGDGRRVEANHFLIAAGAKPRPLEFPGSGLMVDSTAFLELEQLPSRIVFIGGGFVSFEFAHIAARAGATVTILHHSAQLLKGFDPDLVNMLIERSQQVGIGILMSTKPTGIAAAGDSYRVDAEQNGVPVKFDCDLVVHGAGRVPAIDDLDLDKAGIAWTTRGVTVHPHLQSTTRTNVFAAGDAADTPGQPLTPVAVFEGKIAASNMLRKGMKTADYSGVPSAVFTIPELVRVGLLESEAKELGLDHRVRFTDTRGWYSQRRIGETHAGAKIILENGTDRILGAHFFGPEYAEVVNITGLAIRLGLSSADLKTMVSAYPSTGSDLGSLL